METGKFAELGEAVALSIEGETRLSFMMNIMLESITWRGAVILLHTFSDQTEFISDVTKNLGEQMW